MKHLLSTSILAVGLLLLSPSIQAQDHSNRNLSPLRGTYTFTGSAWQDMSVINPALPTGYAPVSLIGSFTIDGNGDMTGWGLVNAGGLQQTAEFVNSHVSAPKADGSFSISLSMRINEFEQGIFGPYSYIGVIEGGGSELEIACGFRRSWPPIPVMLATIRSEATLGVFNIHSHGQLRSIKTNLV